MNGTDDDDRMIGLPGVDELVGGLGDDRYYIYSPDVLVIEAAGGGYDRVYTGVSYTLAAGQEVEVLRALPGSPGLTLTGNELDNRIYGASGDDTLIGGLGHDRLWGGLGADTMTGGGGDDRYQVDDSTDQVIEATGGGYDAVFTRVSYTLAAGQEVETLRAYAGLPGLTLTGNEFDNNIFGASGDDTLIGGLGHDSLLGGLGADSMTGGDGDDRYQVDDNADQVIEATGGGYDTVYSSVNYTLAAGQEVEALRASSGSLGLTLNGNEFDNYIAGTGGDDMLDGGTGNDRIDGYAGNDTISTAGASAVILGGEGDDTIRLDGSSTSTGTADGGIGDDTVRSADLGQFIIRNVETLDTYYGFLSGSVRQIASFDVYTADLAASDAQISFSLRGAGGRLDFTTGIGGDNSVEIRDAGLTSAIRITGSVNGDTLFGSGFNDTLNGGAGNDALYGGDGRDTLNGGIGNDRINGGNGIDYLTGGDGDDTFVFDTPVGSDNIDRITDFTPGSDTIEINQEFYFPGLTVGQLDPSQFAVGAATGTGPQIVYNQANGALSYDSNGADAGGDTRFAILTTTPGLAASDIWIV